MKNEAEFPILMEDLNELAKAFNGLYKVGTELVVLDDLGIAHKRKLLSEAWVLGGHSVVAKFEGLSGCYLVNRVKHQMGIKTTDLGLWYWVPTDANGNYLDNQNQGQ